MNFSEWAQRAWKGAVVDTLLGKDGAGGGGGVAVAAAGGADKPPPVKVTATIPPVAQKGSYALYPGINVKISPPPGNAISAIVAEEWLSDQIDYYESNVVEGDLETSTGATRGQFHMNNVRVREDGFSFSFPKMDLHPAGMPYAQLATFIEVTKGVPIIEVDTNRLAAVVREELEG